MAVNPRLAGGPGPNRDRYNRPRGYMGVWPVTSTGWYQGQGFDLQRTEKDPSPEETAKP